MCGIAGIFSFERSPFVDPLALRRMGDSMSHRGPDGEGFYIDGPVGLAHRRLSIIDLAGGDQPMQNESGEIVLVFNGEIYNYVELRAELRQKGVQFQTQSDTEVIIKAYEAWGLECQNKFNGMWAFALWDRRKNRLLLSRDRIGEKPLNFLQYGNQVLFASEIKAIQAYGVDLQPNLDLLELYLFLGYVPAPYTFYQHVHKVMPGTCLLINREGFKKYTYWKLPEIEEGDVRTEEEEISEEFNELFRNSVEIRMRSDVPYGAFLSGGIDSASIVANMSKVSSFPVNTFTIGFHERAYDERKSAKMIAELFEAKHTAHVLEPGTFDEALESVLKYFDEPFADPAAIPTNWVSKLAARKVKMVLTGDGGDELLAGYSHYQSEKYASTYHQLPRFARNFLPKVVHHTASLFNGDTRYKLNRAERVLSAYNYPFIERMITKFVKIHPVLVKQLAGNQGCTIEEFMGQALKDCHLMDPFYQMTYFNLTVSLPDQMLVKGDKMTMANSLEARTPFLDHRLVELMYQVSKTVKLPSSKRNKNVLKKAMNGTLPDAILYQKKKGFEVPLREWFKDDSFDNKLTLNASLDYIHADLARQILTDNKEGISDNGTLIWRMILLDRWLQKF